MVDEKNGDGTSSSPDVEDASSSKLSSRITDRWNKVSSIQKPEKITRDDILNRWDDSYERRVELAKNVRKPSTISKVVTAASLIGAVLMGVSSANGASPYRHDKDANAAQISSLSSQLADAKNKTVSVPKKEDAAKMVVDADSQAKDIVRIQNVYTADQIKGDSNHISERADEMARHLKGGALFGTSPWYQVTRDKKGNPKFWNTRYTWTSETPYAFENNGTNMRVVWLCRDDKTHALLAWAIGDYSSSSKKFEGLIWGMTNEGSNRVGTEYDGSK